MLLGFDLAKFKGDLEGATSKAGKTVQDTLSRLPGGGQIAGALGAAGSIAGVVGGLLLLTASSKMLQKTIETFFKLFLAILRPIGDVFAVLLRPFLILLLPVVRLLNKLLAPVLRKMQKEGAEGLKEGGGWESFWRTFVTPFNEALKGDVGALLVAVGEIFVGLKLLAFTSGLGTTVLNALLVLGSSIYSGLAFLNLGAFLSAIGAAVVGFVSKIVGWFAALNLSGMLPGILTAVSGFVSKIVGWFAALNLGGMLTSIASAVTAFGKSIAAFLTGLNVSELLIGAGVIVAIVALGLAIKYAMDRASEYFAALQKQFEERVAQMHPVVAAEVRTVAAVKAGVGKFTRTDLGPSEDLLEKLVPPDVLSKLVTSKPSNMLKDMGESGYAYAMGGAKPAWFTPKVSQPASPNFSVTNNLTVNGGADSRETANAISTALDRSNARLFANVNGLAYGG